MTHRDGPALVVAGAGSGKTKTLVHRVAYLVANGVPANQILLLTFTRKSADEMLRRASLLVDQRCRNVSGGTFHGWANGVLREFGRHLGFSSQFTILDRTDSEDLIQMIRKDMGLGKTERRFPKKETIANLLSQTVNKGQTLEGIISANAPQYLTEMEALLQIGLQYAQRKRDMQAMDYDDLLVYLHTLLTEIAAVREQLYERYAYILVDEYQDTNGIQASIVRQLAGTRANVMAVGDDAQSIYAFRGANHRNMLDFPLHYPGTKIVALEQNYRSTQPILDLSNSVIAQAKDRFDKHLFSEKPGKDLPVYVETQSENIQSRFICQKILELSESGVALKEMAVLIRSGWHSNDLEVEMKAHAIPFVKVGGFKFVETAHVKDLVSLIRLRFNPADTLSWNRFLLLMEGIGPKTAITLSQALSRLQTPDKAAAMLVAPTRTLPQGVVDMVEFVFGPETLSLSDLVEEAIALYQPLFEKKYDDHRKRTNDLDSLKSIAERFDSLEGFLSNLSLEPPAQSQTGSGPIGDGDSVTLSTIHSAKGLEWDTVFVISLVDGYLPSFRSIEDGNALEEERRLLYVAITRAKNALFLIKPQLNPPPGMFQFPGFRFSKICRFLSDRSMLQSLTEPMMIVEESAHNAYSSDYSDGEFNDVHDTRKYHF